MEENVEEKSNKLQNFFKEKFGTTELCRENIQKIKESFIPNDPIQQRIYFRRMVAKGIRGIERAEIKKDEIIFNELKKISNESQELLNPIVGFRCLHYSISEGIGKIKVKIINKMASLQKTTGIRFR